MRNAFFSRTMTSSSNSKRYKYYICEFIGYEDQSGNLDFDVIPSSWISYDEKIQSCVAKYPNPPYTQKVKKLIETLAIYEKPNASSWPEWKINIVGGAG